MVNKERLVELAMREREMFENIVHGLRTRGWSRIDAEGEALDRIEKSRSLSTPSMKDEDDD
jgi:hypothetical protein